MAKSSILAFLVWSAVSIGGSWAQEDAPTPTVSAPASRRSDDSNGAQIESLIELAKTILTSAYPSTTITDIASLDWPATLVLGSSTVVFSSDPTTTSATGSSTSSTSSTSTPTAASRANEDESSGGGGVNLGMILGIVFGVVALLLLLLAACLYRRRRSKKRAAGAYTPSDDGSDLLRMSEGRREWPEKYNTIAAPLPPRTASPQFNRYSADENALQNPFTQTSTTASAHPAYRPGELLQERSNSNPYYAPHLHSTTPQSTVPPVPHHPYQSGGSSRDSGYYGHSRENQVAELPASQSSQTDSYPSRNHTFENPFTSPAYTVRSQSNTSISRRPVAKDSFSSLTRHSDNRLSSHLVLERNEGSSDSDNHLSSQPVSSISEEPSESSVAPGTPYVPPRSPKRKSGTYVHYPTATQMSDFDFGFNGNRDRLSNESGYLNPNSASHRA